MSLSVGDIMRELDKVSLHPILDTENNHAGIIELYLQCKELEDKDKEFFKKEKEVFVEKEENVVPKVNLKKKKQIRQLIVLSIIMVKVL